MKILLFVALIIILPASLWAGCTEYDDAVLKSMSKEELRATIKKNHIDSLEVLKRGNEFTESKNLVSHDLEIKSINVCNEQKVKMKKIWIERFKNLEDLEDPSTSTPQQN
jgi:hypothetical protein